MAPQRPPINPFRDSPADQEAYEALFKGAKFFIQNKRKRGRLHEFARERELKIAKDPVLLVAALAHELVDEWQQLNPGKVRKDNSKPVESDRIPIHEASIDGAIALIEEWWPDWLPEFRFGERKRNKVREMLRRGRGRQPRMPLEF